MNRRFVPAVLAVPFVAAPALAVDPVFVDNFNNGIVEDSDSTPAFWAQRNSGSISSAVESGGQLSLTAGGSQYPHGQVASLVQPNFNFFRTPIVVQGTGLNFTSPTSSLNKGIFRLSLASRTIFPEAPVPPAPAPAIDDSEYWADDVLALRIESGNNTPGQYQVALGIKENYPVHNSEYDGFWLFNPINNAGANFPGPIRSFRLAYSPLFWNLSIVHDTSPSDPTPVTKNFTGAVDQFIGAWKDPSDLGPLTGDSAMVLQSQLNNALATEQATASLEQVTVGQLRQGWQGPSGANWSDPANWSDQDILHVNGDGTISSVPNFVGANVKFTGAFGPTIVTTDLDQTLGSMLFDSPGSFTIQPGGLGQGTLQLATRYFRNELRNLQGDHNVISPINIYNDTELDVAAGATLSLSGQMTDVSGAGTLGISKIGAGVAGMLNLRLYNVAVNAGTLRVLPAIAPNAPESAGRVFNLSIAGTPSAPTATLDLTNNTLVVDYDGVSPIDDVRRLLRAGLTGGTGIVSSAATASRRLGYAEGAVLLPGGGTVAGQPVDGTSVVLTYTLAGDANLDYAVGIGDFSVLGANFNTAGGWSRGDFDYDGTVGIGDFSLLAANFNLSLSASGARGGAVPEPTALAAASLAGGLLLARRRGRRA